MKMSTRTTLAKHKKRSPKERSSWNSEFSTYSLEKKMKF